jgi:hypothetical protein
MKCLGRGSGIKDPSGDFLCNTYQVPTSWQKPSVDKSVNYDIALVGCGIGSLYMAYRLTQEALNAGKPLPSIALFEMGETCGGRLQSQFGSGVLNQAVQPDKRSLDYPVQEYGGMRMDPYKHKLLYAAVRDWAHRTYGEDTVCKPVEECDREKGENCCPHVLTRMHVSNIRYASTNPAVGENLEKSTIRDDAPDSPYKTCLLLSDLIVKRFGTDLKDAPALYKDAANKMCDTCEQMGESKDDCVRVCKFFPPATRTPAAISCCGYDLDADSIATASLVGLNSEVTSDEASSLWLFNNGYQNFAESLAFDNGKSAVSPHYNMQLIGVSTNCGSTEDLVNLQAKSVDEKGPSNVCTKTNDAPVTLDFANGAQYTAKMAYLTPLPFDLPQMDGFAAWESQLLKYSAPNAAVKVVIGWTDEKEAIAARTNLRPCVSEGSPCDRLILDGKVGEQILRQVWLWDSRTIMLYLTADAAIDELPANLIAEKAWKEGMNSMVDTIMEQLKVGTGIQDLAYPDYVRFKRWTPGSLLVDWKEENPAFAERMSRPLGNGAPVYYGNSEMAPDGNMHGWAEGALEMAEMALKDILPALGLEHNDPVTTTTVPTTDAPVMSTDATTTDATVTSTDAPTKFTPAESVHV